MPGRNVTVIVVSPSAVFDDDRYSMFSTPLISCSSGAATVSAMVSAEAPGNTAVTATDGGAISGYCASGRNCSEKMPISVITTEITPAKIGLSIKKRDMRV